VPVVIVRSSLRFSGNIDAIVTRDTLAPKPISAASVSVRNVSKTFGTGASAVHAVNDVSVDIADGEFFCLLGPSGSGKTTLLRVIAGFELPTSGTVSLLGHDVTNLAPFDRDVNTVFQDYALFPHMTVRQNVEYGLKVKGVGKSDRKNRAVEALDSVQLGAYGERKPQQLSGGQRQRVALARALVNRPKVLLLDEPLGALDLKLRQQMQVELKAIQTSVGITFVFVTHDQEEALTMSDRIAVFNNGKIEQVGTPTEVYEKPLTPFVASFVGTSNMVEGDAAMLIAGRSGTFTIRPEKIRIDFNPTTSVGAHTVLATIEHVEYLGAFTRYRTSGAAGSLTVVQQNGAVVPPDVSGLVGRSIALSVDPESVIAI
jgi:putative spermidine/putrescine transport system ATP-binding protein